MKFFRNIPTGDIISENALNALDDYAHGNSGGWEAVDPNEPLFYIVETNGACGDNVLFWRPKSSGYTVDLNRAGIYPANLAQGIAKMREGTYAVLVHVVESHTRRVVNRDKTMRLIKLAAFPEAA